MGRGGGEIFFTHRRRIYVRSLITGCFCCVLHLRGSLHSLGTFVFCAGGLLLVSFSSSCSHLHLSSSRLGTALLGWACGIWDFRLGTGGSLHLYCCSLCLCLLSRISLSLSVIYIYVSISLSISLFQFQASGRTLFCCYCFLLGTFSMHS